MKILLVDDDFSSISALANLLEFNNTICIANNGRDALDRFNTNNYDVVVTDIKMPVMNGLDLVKEIREIDKDVRIIIVTGHSNDQYRSLAQEFAVDGFFTKPLDVRIFMETLTEIECKISLQ